MKPRTVSALDIGSSKICGLAAELSSLEPISILAYAAYPSGGIVKGEIVDLNETIDSASRVLRALSDKAPKMSRDLYVNISGQNIKGERARGMIPLSLRGREVTSADIDRCVNVASTLRLPFDREIIHKIVNNFSIDDQPWIMNPLGLYASRLACEIYVITANVNHVQNIYKCINNAGYDVRELVFTGIADGAGLLDKTEKDEGILLLDTGSSLTEIAIFSSGALRDMDVMAIGMNDIKGDFRTSVELSSILARVGIKIEESLSKGMRIGSIRLAGGIAFNDAVVDFLTEKLAYPIKVGSPKDIRGQISGLDALKATTAIGLLKYARDKSEAKPLEAKNPLHRLSSKVLDIFNNYF